MRIQFSLVMSTELRGRLDEAADRKCMSRSEYIRWLVDKGLDLAYDAGFCDALDAALPAAANPLPSRKEMGTYGARKSTYA